MSYMEITSVSGIVPTAPCQQVALSKRLDQSYRHVKTILSTERMVNGMEVSIGRWCIDNNRLMIETSSIALASVDLFSMIISSRYGTYYS